MIIDKVENLHRYFELDRKFVKVADKLRELPRDIAEGRYELSDVMYMLIQTPKAVEFCSCNFETHRNYIDVQVILEGEEMLSLAQAEELCEYKEYDAGKDIALYKGADNTIKMSAGMFYVMYPGEAHKCCCNTTPGLPLKKAVFKLKAQ